MGATSATSIGGKRIRPHWVKTGNTLTERNISA
jgi:hypothetical protein